MAKVTRKTQTSKVLQTLKVSRNSNGFQETEIGYIPQEWEVTTIGDVASISQKPRGLDLSAYEHIPFFPMQVLPTEGVFATSYVLKSPDEISSGTYVEKGDLLVSKITPSFENGKQAIVEDIPTPFAYATTEVYPLHPDPERLDRMYLFYYLKQSRVRIEIAGKMEGTTGRQRVPKAVVENYPIPLPPLPEQRAIAHILSTIQRAIAAQDAVIAAAREVKRSLMHRLFTYGPYADPLPTRETEIGEVPEAWNIAQLGELCEFLQYGTSERCNTDPSGIPVLRIPNVVNGRVDTSDLKFIKLPSATVKHLQLEVGDLLFVRTNGRREYTGRCAVFKGELPQALFASYLIRARVERESLLSEFVQAYAETLQGKSFLSGRASNAADGKFNINTQTIKSVSVPVPSLAEQAKIASGLHTCDIKIAIEENRKSALQALFKSMLHELMTGKVRVGMQQMPAAQRING